MEAIKQLTDKEILMRAVEDQGYLALLVKRYRTPLYNFVYRFVG
ncbi:MAG TPA: RNA polymerase subunit sigma-24, partial [Candidatus Latescibacteria bacterium]|nr:RNA polymerase subunit sigma-24 [Candidatus Latescibacterota bacterium]